VDISISQRKDHVLLCFQDDGPGFSETLLKRNIQNDSIGYKLINGIVRKNLKGNLIVENDNGAKVSITFNTISYKDEVNKHGS
jgi:two-component sensor histidine kinase